MESRIPTTGRHKAEQQILKMLEASPFKEITKNAVYSALEGRVNKGSIAYSMELYSEEIEQYNEIELPLGISEGYANAAILIEPKYFVLFSKTQDCHHVIRVEKFNRTDERDKGWELVSKDEMTYEEADAFLVRRRGTRIEEYKLNIEFGKTESGNFTPRSLTVNGVEQDFNFLLWLGNSIMRVAQYQSDIDYTHQIEQPKKAPRKGYVYLMIDKNTGYHKIGFSKDPKHREKTLQSEKPTIELLHKFEGSMSKERELHKKYDAKRIRGEWFDLNQKDIDYIKTL